MDSGENVASRVPSAPNAAYAFVTAFFEELARSGVEHICVSPGSRSTPLAVVAARETKLRCWSHLDERAAAFFALGLAKATRKPVALVCTSGTAVANYLPAVVEAHYAGVPLLILSADRPHELREWGAGQTIDQQKLFGTHLRFYAELPVPEAGSQALRHARLLACRVVAESLGSWPGPVHLNWPLRKPLDPTDTRGADFAGWGEHDELAEHGRGDATERPYARVSAGVSRATPGQIEALVERVLANPMGVIVCGADDAPPSRVQAVAELAEFTGWPVLAEPTSQLRSGPHCAQAPVLGCSDLILRDAGFAQAQRPEVVLRFGGTPVSKAIAQWLDGAAPRHLILVDAGGAWNDPDHRASDLLCVEPELLCRDLCQALADQGMQRRKSDWLDRFLRADRLAAQVVAGRMAAEPQLFEPRAVRELCDQMPEDALLYVSNSMPVRDLDAFMPVSQRCVRVLSNRGANGIDGMVSSALGAAASGHGPTVLLTGDLAFLHDVGGLLAARRNDLRATIVVLNNDGGGIFSFLPIAEFGEAAHFEALFGTPHGVDLAHAAALYGLDYTRVESWDEYSIALDKAAHCPGVSIVEVPVEREANVAHFRSLVASVSEALAAAGGKRD